ncbi:chloride channel protein [Actinomarinicola tropica]|uniref:CBS domain-containing protein n=1 Tax=Actinomarinicola tropica TaxID=2789776 RepID=A0A5Q2RRE5_9ACTN|nr:chloride channel protein [Actinomarinicola tropica]QGG96717.1 CBS domain-containing protein [Actinomarinicola tropica]
MHPTTSTRRLLLLASLAAVLGLVGGGAAWVLVHLIDLITNLALFGELSAHARSFEDFEPGPTLFLVAVAGGLLISALARWAPVIRGHGIPETMEAVLTKQSRIAPRTALAKPVSAAIAIGTGAPFGAEGPIIVTGGSIGSLLGQAIPVTPSERKILLAVGAAAGMAATFGAPLAAVVLAIELLLFEFSARAFVPLVVATSIAGGMHSALFGHGPLFEVPAHDVAGLEVLPAFALLGLACGVLAIVVSKGLFAIEGLYRRLPVGDFWHPAIGAVGFATVGLFVPRALGVGYDAIGDVLAGEVAVATAGGLALGKLIAWWLALGSGTSGGTLAPILLISSAFGTVAGSVINDALPGPDVALGAFAVVAMAATFGAATQATFTSIVFVFELTRDYDVILPLMLATVIADVVYSAVCSDSLMTEKLRRRGLRIGRHYGVDPFAGVAVGEIMTSDVETLPASSSVGDARTRFTAGGHGAYPLVDGDALVGIVARGDILRDDAPDDAPLADSAARDVVSTRPESTAQHALQVMVEEHVEHLPVVDGDGRLVGMCTRTDLLKVRRRQMELERRQDGSVVERFRRRDRGDAATR